jgi:hypothetical protein
MVAKFRQPQEWMDGPAVYALPYVLQKAVFVLFSTPAKECCIFLQPPTAPETTPIPLLLLNWQLRHFSMLLPQSGVSLSLPSERLPSAIGIIRSLSLRLVSDDRFSRDIYAESQIGSAAAQYPAPGVAASPVPRSASGAGVPSAESADAKAASHGGSGFASTRCCPNCVVQPGSSENRSQARDDGSVPVSCCAVCQISKRQRNC